MLFLSSLILALSIGQAPQPAETTGRVAGRITIEGTNTAVAGARVTLLPDGRPMGPVGPMGPMGMPPQTMTDQDGRFVFERLVPASYRLDMQKTGFVPLNQGGPGLPLAVKVIAGRATTIDLQLQKGGVITGRVTDPAGEPMGDVRIMALQRAPAMMRGGGSPRLFPAPGGGAQTNDIGEFRLSGLAAGEYYIVAMPRGAMPFGGPGVTPAATGNARQAIAATFYPGTTDQASAHPVAVTAGAEVGNISFTMLSARAFRVSGVVVDENGEPIAEAMVMATGDPRGGIVMGPAGTAQSGADGRFSIGELPAGSYRVTASIPIRMDHSGGGSWVSFGSTTVSGGIVGGTTSGTVGGSGVQPAEVTVADADVTGVRVVVQRPRQ